MTTIDLGLINLNPIEKLEAINWLYQEAGPNGSNWEIVDLRYLKFKDARLATIFLLKWSS